MKGGYGTTRWVPILPELARALERLLSWLGRRYELTPGLPLFLSREHAADGAPRPLCRQHADRVLKSTYARAGVFNDGRLGTHSLRKTFARHVYNSSGHDLMVLKAALGHSDVCVTQKYLEVGEDRVFAAMARCDFTRQPRRRPLPAPTPAPAPFPSPQPVAGPVAA